MNVKRLRANPKARERWEEIREIVLNVKWFPRALKICQLYIQVPKNEKGSSLTSEWIGLKSQLFIFWNRNFSLPFTYVFVCVYVCVFNFCLIGFLAFFLFLFLNLDPLTFSLTIFTFSMCLSFLWAVLHMSKDLPGNFWVSSHHSNRLLRNLPRYFLTSDEIQALKIPRRTGVWGPKFDTVAF